MLHFCPPLNLLSFLAPAVPVPRYPTIFSLLPFAYSKIVGIFCYFYYFFGGGPLILKALVSCVSFFSNDCCKVEYRQPELKPFLLVVDFDVGCGVASCLATVQLASQALTNDIPFFSFMLYAYL